MKLILHRSEFKAHEEGNYFNDLLYSLGVYENKQNLTESIEIEIDNFDLFDSSFNLIKE